MAYLPALIAHDAELASVGITTVFEALRAGSIRSGKGRYIDYARKLADELLAARAVATVASNPAKAADLTDRDALQVRCGSNVLPMCKVDQTPLLRGVWSRGNNIA